VPQPESGAKKGGTLVWGDGERKTGGKKPELTGGKVHSKSGRIWENPKP